MHLYRWSVMVEFLVGIALYLGPILILSALWGLWRDV
jgi:hypothetical protein